MTNSIAGSGNFRRDERYTDLAGFAQDDFRLTQHLTLNVGVRYEIFGAPTETNGRLPNFNALSAAQGPLTDAGTFSGFTLPANFHGQLPDGVLKTSYASFYKTPHNDISPRFGFAWQIPNISSLLLRGGFGIYYDQHSGNLAEQTLSQLPFATSQFAFGSQNGAASLSNPFVPLVLPATSYPVFQPRTPDSFPFIEGTNPDLRDGRTYEYNLALQYQFGRQILNVGYVGTRSVNRPGQVEFDQALPARNTRSTARRRTPSTTRVRDSPSRASARARSSPTPSSRRTSIRYR